MEMKKGDLIIVYKVCVGSLYNEKDIKDILNAMTEKFSFVNSPNVIQYFVPVHKESEHPVEVIDTSEIKTDVLTLLEELLKEISLSKKIGYESKID